MFSVLTLDYVFRSECGIDVFMSILFTTCFHLPLMALTMNTMACFAVSPLAVRPSMQSSRLLYSTWFFIDISSKTMEQILSASSICSVLALMWAKTPARNPGYGIKCLKKYVNPFLIFCFSAFAINVIWSSCRSPVWINMKKTLYIAALYLKTSQAGHQMPWQGGCGRQPENGLHFHVATWTVVV